ncbi:DUF6897 domain-containing protein [Clostridium psychrophilum]|uniref:DUF6897 domain-containing protein n=1 Tax=Clostridium psychrophilum TaxID=132926 RepID=UPI0028B225DE|nr:hypothetical protein [Clostridium psychrophilum]
MSSSWIAICIPLFVIFFIVLPRQREMKKLAILKSKKRKGLIIMTNELIKKYIGKTCSISTGEFGTSATGKIIDVNENWIEVETKKGKELINAEFVQSIKIT